QQSKGTRYGQAQANSRSLHSHIALPAGALWPAPRGINQDYSGLGGPRRQPRAQGFVAKGGRQREIPIRTHQQRELIDQAKALAKGKSLVAPRYDTYRDYLKYFRYQCERVGIHAFHGHRHFYAQTRYQELTGWACPARGGIRSKQLTPKQREIDRRAREVISREMGHGREQISAVYLGR